MYVRIFKQNMKLLKILKIQHKYMFLDLDEEDKDIKRIMEDKKEIERQNIETKQPLEGAGNGLVQNEFPLHVDLKKKNKLTVR